MNSTIPNIRNHESVNVVDTITQKDKLQKPEISFPYPQRLKREVIHKELQVSQHEEEGRTSSTTSRDHTNVDTVTMRSQKVGEDEKDKATYDD